MNNLTIGCNPSINFCARPPKSAEAKSVVKKTKLLTFDQGEKDFEKMNHKLWLDKYRSDMKMLRQLLVQGYKNKLGFMTTRLENIPPFDVIMLFKNNLADMKKLYTRDRIVEQMYQHEGEYMRGEKSIIEELSEKSPKALDKALFEQNVRTGKIPLHVFMEDNKMEFVESLNKAYKSPKRLETLADMYLVKDESKNVDYPLRSLPEITYYQRQKLVSNLEETFDGRPDLLEKVLKTME